MGCNSGRDSYSNTVIPVWFSFQLSLQVFSLYYLGMSLFYELMTILKVLNFVNYFGSY